MQSLGISSGSKWLCSLYVVFLFVVLSAPITYRFTHKLLHKLCKISKANGRPTRCGLFLHAVVFLLLIRGSMCMKEGMKTDRNKLQEGKNHKHGIDLNKLAEKMTVTAAPKAAADDEMNE